VDHSLYPQDMSGKHEENLATTPTPTSNNHEQHMQEHEGSVKTDHPLYPQGMGGMPEHDQTDNSDNQHDNDENDVKGTINWRSGGSCWQGTQSSENKDENNDEEGKKKEQHTLMAQGGMQEE
jgi:hypothetical protein